MALLARQSITTNGLSPSYVNATSSGDLIDNRSGYPVFSIVNNGLSSITVTFSAQRECNLGELHDISATIPADGEAHIYGPFRQAIYNNTDEKVEVSYSDVEDVTVCVMEIQV